RTTKHKRTSALEHAQYHSTFRHANARAFRSPAQEVDTYVPAEDTGRRPRSPRLGRHLGVEDSGPDLSLGFHLHPDAVRPGSGEFVRKGERLLREGAA